LRLVLMAAVSAGLAAAGTFTYGDFSDVSGLTINPAAAQAGNVLRVVPNVGGQAGSAYQTSAVSFDSLTRFSTAFEFLVTTDPGNPTDGFTFILQNQDVNAVGGAGDGSGYTGISPSVAVLFRGRGPALVGVYINGNDLFSPVNATPMTENDIYNHNEFAWIDYDPLNTFISVYLDTSSTKPGAPIVTANVDVAGTLGSQAWVGFTGGTGAASGDNDILKWSFDSQQVPEPGTASIYAIGLMGLGLLRRVWKR